MRKVTKIRSWLGGWSYVTGYTDTGITASIYSTNAIRLTEEQKQAFLQKCDKNSEGKLPAFEDVLI